MAAGTRVPCDGQINCISKERKQFRKKKCLNTWIYSLWAGRFFHMTSYLEPGESSSGLKGQNKVSCFNSSATWNEESLFCRQKSGSDRHLRHATRCLRHTSRASITELCDLICAKQFNTKLYIMLLDVSNMTQKRFINADECNRRFLIHHLLQYKCAQMHLDSRWDFERY